ncbi:hypothetical protein NL676_009137 [Syzygium grande]|nr:hypothetical protein NL676_009137 [Syzygium grande]
MRLSGVAHVESKFRDGGGWRAAVDDGVRLLVMGGGRHWAAAGGGQLRAAAEDGQQRTAGGGPWWEAANVGWQQRTADGAWEVASGRRHPSTDVVADDLQTTCTALDLFALEGPKSR